MASSKAAEAELKRRITSLQEELDRAQDSLKKLHDGGATNGASTSTPSTPSTPMRSISSISSTVSARPAGKRGYLFKWLDRSIGWGGTKWALRFVVLEGGRVSYFGAHTDTSSKYSLSLRGCAVRDDGWKRNRRHQRSGKGDPPLEETGAYFFLFSIYQRPDGASSGDDSEIVPLLRFSTPSMAEKTQWVRLISEACAYSETDSFLVDEDNRFAEEMRQQQQKASMAMAMPEAREGTLPPLYFAPAKKTHARRPSTGKPPKAEALRTKSKTADAEKVESRSRKGYPPSKPMHRCAAPSFLSAEAPAQNYRGFFNLGIVILILSNFRLILDTIVRNGFVVTQFYAYLRELPEIRKHPLEALEQFPLVFCVMLQLGFSTACFLIEWHLSQKRLEESIGMTMHYTNAYSALLIPILIVWNSIDNPAIGAIILFHATISWMKLVSYAHANEDYRRSSRKAEDDTHEASKLLVANLDPDDEDITYPQNVTIQNLMYFTVAPTLTYQIAFPKYPQIQWLRVGGILLRMIVMLSVFFFVAAQVTSPALAELIEDLEETQGTYTASMLVQYGLKLSIANTYLWLLMFYVYFHLYLNLLSEILRFGDRVFYKDWWNSAEVSAYWRLWNTPVHYWLVRHVFFPCLRLKMSKMACTLVVFFLSAVLHEVLVSVPFHMIRPWSFLGMMMQVPLVACTKYLHRRYPGSSIGNIIFWISFCVVGQPMAILMYTIDYQYAKNHPELGITEGCRVELFDQCFIR